MGSTAPRVWNKTGSFFWNFLIKIRPLFISCTSWVVGDGKTIAFWYDAWDGPPILDYRENFKPPQPLISLCEATPVLSTLAPQVSLTFSDQRDELIWNLTTNGTYTSRSIYRVLIEGGKVEWENRSIWIAKVPPSVSLFGVLMLQNKILTREVLQFRNIPCQPACSMCNSGDLETVTHLLFTCPYAKAVWSFVQIASNKALISSGLPSALSLEEIWAKSWQHSRNHGMLGKKEWQCRALCVCWWLWRQRNEVIFKGTRRSAIILGQKILHESKMWLKFC